MRQLAEKEMGEPENIRIQMIVGSLAQKEMAEAVHEVSHNGSVEYIDLTGDDMRRHRLRAITDCGTVCAISLPRHATLENGSVLLLEKTRAIVVRMQERKWLRIAPVDVGAALEAGYFAGNMHWPVRFEDGRLAIELQGPLERYLERLDFMILSKRIAVLRD